MLILFPLLFPNPYKLPLLFYLPYFPYDETPFFQLTYIYQAIAIYITCEALITFDLTIFNLMNHSQKNIDILIINLNLLNKNISEYVAKAKPYKVVEDKFRTVIELHKKTKSFIKKLQSCLSVIIFAQFSTNVYGICISMNSVYEVLYLLNQSRQSRKSFSK